MKDVHKKVIARKLVNDLKQILVIGDPAWPAGILGIIASKILEEYNLTTFVWGSEGDVIKGSCRGVGDVSVVTLMESISHVFVHFGGHEDAGGFSMTRETVHFLEEELCKNYDEFKKPLPNPTLDSLGSNSALDGIRLLQGEGAEHYDLELDLADVTLENYHALRKMAPFGMGNPTPVFAFKNIIIESVRQFGKTNEHLEVVVRQQTSPLTPLLEGEGNRALIKAISWYATPESFSEKIEQGKTMTLLGEFDFSVFRGKSELRLKIVDFLKMEV
jgi:single-stranded-DNA-specific exonuclease